MTKRVRENDRKGDATAEATATELEVTVEEYTADAKAALERARKEHAQARGSLGGLISRLRDEEQRQARENEFESSKVIELRERAAFQEKRVEYLRRVALEAQGQLQERQRKYREAIERAYREKAEQLVEKLHSMLLEAKDISDKLIALPKTGYVPSGLWFEPLHRSLDVGSSYLER